MKKLFTCPEVTRTSRWAMFTGTNGTFVQRVESAARHAVSAAVPASPATAGAREVEAVTVGAVVAAVVIVAGSVSGRGRFVSRTGRSRCRLSRPEPRDRHLADEDPG